MKFIIFRTNLRTNGSIVTIIMQFERKEKVEKRRSSTVLHDNSVHFRIRERVVLWAQHVVSDVSTRISLSLSASRINSNLNHSLPQDKGLLISRSERAALLFGTLRNRINTALTSRLRDYPNYSTWDLIQVCNQGKGEKKRILVNRGRVFGREDNRGRKFMRKREEDFDISNLNCTHRFYSTLIRIYSC